MCECVRCALWSAIYHVVGYTAPLIYLLILYFILASRLCFECGTIQSDGGKRMEKDRKMSISLWVYRLCCLVYILSSYSSMSSPYIVLHSLLERCCVDWHCIVYRVVASVYGSDAWMNRRKRRASTKKIERRRDVRNTRTYTRAHTKCHGVHHVQVVRKYSVGS